MKKIQQGFTLIELMIVVAIIGILAAVAIPAYQDYIVKSKLAKVMSTMEPIKLALGTYYTEYGGFPTLGTATNPVTFAMNSTPLGTTPGQDVWSSVGFTTYPTLPREVSSLSYTSSAAAPIQAANISLTLTLANVKATLPAAGGVAIDGSTVALSPTRGTTAAGALAAGAAVTGTAIIFFYACSTTDVVALKAFNNSGAMCQPAT